MDKERIGEKHNNYHVFVENVEKGFSLADKEKILSALSLMIEVHHGQSPRSDGQPYSTHPLKVALQVLESMDKLDADMVIAALLHDSVEDQSLKLSKKYSSEIHGNEREVAIHYIRSTFGDKVATIVSSLSNPDFHKVLKGTGRE